MKIILALLLVFLFLSCDDKIKNEPAKCEIDLVNHDNNTCSNGFVCDGAFCVESKCDTLKIVNCNNENMKCDHETGNCIPAEEYCVLEGEIQRKDNSCGLNNTGSQRVICKKWKWVKYTECDDIENCKDGCIDDGICVNGEIQNSTTVCGFNNEGFIIEKCENSQWVTTEECTGTDECVNGEIQNIACGFNDNGKQEQKCENGQWVNQGDCLDFDVCTIGEKKTEANSCGPNNSGTQKLICINGQWENDVCSKVTEMCLNGCIYNAVCEEEDVRNTTIVCGFNNEGIIIEECQDGQWVNNGLCSGTDVCTNGTEDTIECGFNNRGIAFATCVNGQWNQGICDDPDVCIDNSLGLYELCGFNNNGYVQSKCVTGQWDILNQPCNPVQSKMIGNDYTDESNIILTDSNNNIYVVANLNCDGNFESCHYKIYKYDNNLNLLKSSSETSETGKIKSAVLDGNDGIILVGYNYNNSNDLLIERYETTNLTRTHSKTDGTLREDAYTDIYVYKNANNVPEYYAVGYTMADLVMPGYNISPENKDLFYSKLSFSQVDTSINATYEYQLGVNMNEGRGDIIPSKILVDENYVYISGSTNGSLEQEMPAILYYDLFFIRVNKQDNTLAESDKFQISTTSGDGYVKGMKFDNAKEKILIAGQFLGKIENMESIDFSPFLITISVAQIETQLYKKVEDTNVSDRANGLFVDSNDNIYITGYTDGNMPDNQNYYSGTNSQEKADIFITKLDAQTNKVWTKQLGTNKNDEGHGVVVDLTGNVFIVGKTRGEIGGQNIVGSWNVFISKLSKRLICTIENNQECE